MRKIIILLLFSCSFCPLWLGAQHDTALVTVRGRATENAIQLRWAVNTAMAWKQTNRDGFRIVRYTVMRGDTILPQAEMVPLTAQPLKAQPLDNWAPLAQNNEYAAIIAQALYGDSFELGEGEKGSVARIVALSQELEQRYMVAMYAADLSYEAALMAGWAFTDTTVKAGERYLYRVIPEADPKALPVQFGFVYIGIDDHTPLPVPQELAAVFGDKSVLLTWNYAMLQQEYSCYYIEKSTDNQTFTGISNLPVMNMQGTDRMYYTDTLENNRTTYYYRIRGLNIFGEQSPPSDTVHGKGRTVLPYTPHITRSVVNDQGLAEIEWEFEEAGNLLIKSFDLQWAGNVNGPFETVVPGISPAQRFVLYNKLAASNYFLIAAMPHEGEPRLSMPILLQPLDTVPPAVPSGLQGSIDSSGIVSLLWTPNTEPDLLGYRIYRAQRDNEEPVPLNDTAWPLAVFSDTLNIRSLNSMVYYAVTALDKRHNQSAQTPVLALKKPDIIPPSSPVIDDYKITDTGITFRWIPSGSDDVAAYHIYRKMGTQSQPVLVDSTVAAVHAYTDQSFIPGATVTYFIVATDDAGLSSKPSPSITLKAPAKANIDGGIQTFKAGADRRNKRVRLQWTHNLQDIKEFQLYRKDDSDGAYLALWKMLPPAVTTIDDMNVEPGHAYQYMIRALYVNGKSTPAKTVSITY